LASGWRSFAEWVVESALLGNGPAGVRILSSNPDDERQSPLDVELLQLLRAETAGC